MKLKAIIFDITGVLYPFQPWVGERPSHEYLMAIKRLVIDLYDESNISPEYLQWKLSQSDRSPEELTAIYKSLTVIDENLLACIKKLAQSYDIYAMANETEKWTDIRKALHGFDRYFKKLYISSEVGMRKPEPDIYQLFLQESGLQPVECLFVDDKEANVATARELGLHGYVYRDFPSFERYLKDNGISPK